MHGTTNFGPLYQERSGVTFCFTPCIPEPRLGDLIVLQHHAGHIYSWHGGIQETILHSHGWGHHKQGGGAFYRAIEHWNIEQPRIFI